MLLLGNLVSRTQRLKKGNAGEIALCVGKSSASVSFYVTLDRFLSLPTYKTGIVIPAFVVAMKVKGVCARQYTRNCLASDIVFLPLPSVTGAPRGRLAVLAAVLVFQTHFGCLHEPVSILKVGGGGGGCSGSVLFWQKSFLG